MFSTNQISKAVRLALIFGVSSGFAFSQHVLAQSTGESAAEEVDRTERIQVTGSRIKRTDMETAQPVLTISSEDIARSGLTSVGDILREISTNGASLGLQTNNGNTSGVVRVDLRNCGANRSLVLVNGRRWVANLNGAVDISTIPLAAIKRMEVLKDGASSVYGTDAICGVVNVITNDDFDGAEVTVYQGVTSESDGKRESYAMTVGSSSARSSVLFSASYVKQEPILGGDREISSVPIFGLPANVSSTGGRASPTTPYGQFNVGGTSFTLDPNKPGCLPNQRCTAIGDFRPYNGATDGYNFAPVNYIQQPSETISLYLQGTYNLTDNLRSKTEILFNQRSSEAQLAAQPFGGAPMRISANNVYNPFGVDIAGATFRPLKAPRSFQAEVDTWRFGTGFEGEFDAAGRMFNWDVGYVYSESSNLQMKRGFFSSTRMTTALGPSFIDSNGVARCGTAAAPIAGCVPFNLFGGPDGVTDAMLGYVQVDPRNVEFQKMHDYTANIGTDLFELPAGPVSAVVGAEVRRESGYSSPDPLTAAGQVLNDNAFQPTAGGYSLREIYGEAVLPILRDAVYADSLDLSLSTRYSDYSTFGSTTNSSVKLSYRPFEELLVRASYGEGFRAPSISELFLGNSDSRPAATDPCTNNSQAYTTNQAVRDRCAAQGVPATYRQQGAQLRSTIGGNADAQPETATTRVVGFVYSPNFVDGLGISVDWYSIRIENSLGTNSAGGILNNCYVAGIQSFCDLISRDFTGSLGNIGEISNIIQTTTNFIGGLETEGLDVNVDYRFSTELGNWRVSWDNAYVNYYGNVGKIPYGSVTPDGTISAGNVIGELAGASSGGGSRNRLKSNLTLAWNMNDFFASVTAQYMSKQIESCANITNAANSLGRPELRALCSNPDNERPIFAFVPGSITETVATVRPAPENKLGSVVYLDAQFGWESPWNSRFTVGVRNLLDKDPPLAFSAFANTFEPSYRTPGRFFYASVTQRF